jgi:phage recombination protein Bet
MSGAVPAIRAEQTEWTGQQKAALEAIGIGKAPMAQQQLFLAQCQRTGLDPFSRQIHMLERRSRTKDGKWETRWTIQTGIDGYRLIAERTGRWEGTSEPQWCGEDGKWRDVWTSQDPPHAARVLVYKRGFRMPVVGLAMFAEYDQGQALWKTKPAHMIAKVAEAQALRKAFPQDMSGIYIAEEVDAGHDRSVSTAHLHRPKVTAERVDTDTGEVHDTAELVDEPSHAGWRTMLTRIGELFTAAGITDPDQRLLWVNQELAKLDMLAGKPVDHATDLTGDQAGVIVDLLTELTQNMHSDEEPSS